MPRILSPVPQDAVTDWSGRIVPKAMIDHLYPSCIVRIIVRNNETQGAEALYFKITKIKDGTFWGETMDTYRLGTFFGTSPIERPISLKEGEHFTWRREHINEIPLKEWQPKRYLKLVKGLNDKVTDKGYFVTGLRGSCS